MKINSHSTHCFLVRNGKVLLGIKKRGIGWGKWNGIGGKKQTKDKTIIDTFIRETQEEIGVTPIEYKKMAFLKFYYLANQKDNQTSTVFVTTKWKGKPIETAEEKPKWWPINKLPFYNMWEDDPSWLPFVLSGKFIKAKYVFDKDGKIKKFEVRGEKLTNNR
jgi:8-oxo-dGTP pyrophosphatase MutT (NUDIX family)